MKKILLIVAVIAMSGCVTKKAPVAPVIKPIDEPKQAPIFNYNNSSEYRGGSECNWRYKDSIVCRIKRIQGILGDLENNAVTAIGGIGNCSKCGY